MHRENSLIIFFFWASLIFHTWEGQYLIAVTSFSFCLAVTIKGILAILFSLSQDENGKGLSDEEIVGEVMTFMFAGHDTTASGMCTREIVLLISLLWCRSYFGLSDSCNVCILLFISVFVIIISIITTIFLLLLIKVIIIDIIIIIIIIIIVIIIFTKVIMLRTTFWAFPLRGNHLTPIKTSRKDPLITIYLKLFLSYCMDFIQLSKVSRTSREMPTGSRWSGWAQSRLRLVRT